MNKTKDAHNGVGYHNDLQSRRTLDHHSSIASVSSSTHSNVSSATESERHEVARNREMRSSSSARKPVPDEAPVGRNGIVANIVNKQKESMSVGRQEAFEIFKRDYADNQVIEENKLGLKNRYSDAKKLGAQVNSSRQAINRVKGLLEKLTQQKSRQGSSREEARGLNEEEKTLRETMEQEKANYKSAFNQLKALKGEIEHMQHLMEKSKLKMQKDFEIWFAEESSRLSNPEAFPTTAKTAWRTPPITPLEHDNSRSSSNEQTRSANEAASSLRHHRQSSRHTNPTNDEHSSHGQRSESAHRKNKHRSRQPHRKNKH